MLSFKAYLAEKKSKILINPKKDELKEVLKKNHGEDCDCMKCEQKRRKDDVNDGPDVQNEAAPLAAIAKVAAKAAMGGVKAAAKGSKVAAKASKAAAKVGKATKGVRKTYNTAKKVGNVASGVSSAMSSANSDNNSSSTTLEAKEYTGPDKKDRKLIKKMDNPSYLKKFKDYEKNMDPKKRQALKDKATKGMKFTHEERDTALDIVKKKIIAKYGKGAIMSGGSRQQKKVKGQKDTRGTGKYKKMADQKKQTAADAKKRGFKNTRDYIETMARYGGKDNYDKGKGLGT